MLSVLFQAFAGVSLAHACDPRSSSCQAIPAMPSSKQYDLTTTNSADFAFVIPSRITQSGSSLQFSVQAQGDAPTLITNDYLLYGNVKADIVTAPGVGMVSAFILMSDVLDEIDWEQLGAETSQIQTNYYYRGETAGYNRGGFSTVSSPSATSHTYELDWTDTTLRWIIDGVTVRTLNKADTAGYGYPSTPCQIKIGVWASGDPTNAAGTISWGGGLIDYTKGPYTMTLSSLSVTSYTDAKSFLYTANGANVISQKDVAALSSGSSSVVSQIGGNAALSVTSSASAASASARPAVSTRSQASAPGVIIATAPNSSAGLRTSTRASAATTGTSVATSVRNVASITTTAAAGVSQTTTRTSAAPSGSTTSLPARSGANPCWEICGGFLTLSMMVAAQIL